MPINRAKLETRRAAILAKSAAAIHAANVWIPSLGSAYTQAQVQAWLDGASAHLTRWMTMTDAQITSDEQSLYNALSAANKLIADAIRAGSPFNLLAATGADYDRLRGIVLYKYINS